MKLRSLLAVCLSAFTLLVNAENIIRVSTEPTDLVFRVADNEAAIKVLTKNGIRPLCQDDMEGMFK